MLSFGVVIVVRCVNTLLLRDVYRKGAAGDVIELGLINIGSNGTGTKLLWMAGDPTDSQLQTSGSVMSLTHDSARFIWENGTQVPFSLVQFAMPDAGSSSTVLSIAVQVGSSGDIRARTVIQYVKDEPMMKSAPAQEANSICGVEQVSAIFENAELWHQSGLALHFFGHSSTSPHMQVTATSLLHRTSGSIATFNMPAVAEAGGALLQVRYDDSGNSSLAWSSSNSSFQFNSKAAILKRLKVGSASYKSSYFDDGSSAPVVPSQGEMFKVSVKDLEVSSSQDLSVTLSNSVGAETAIAAEITPKSGYSEITFRPDAGSASGLYSLTIKSKACPSSKIDTIKLYFKNAKASANPSIVQGGEDIVIYVENAPNTQALPFSKDNLVVEFNSTMQATVLSDVNWLQEETVVKVKAPTLSGFEWPPGESTTVIQCQIYRLNDEAKEAATFLITYAKPNAPAITNKDM